MTHTNSFISEEQQSRTEFGQMTNCNCIHFTIDGMETFALMYEKIKGAKTSIHILGYDIDLQLQFIRKNLRHQSPLAIQSQCKLEEIRESNSNTRLSKVNDLLNLLVEKARENIDIKIIVWQPKSLIGWLPGTKKRGIESRREKVQTLKEIAKENGLNDRIDIRLDSNTPSLTSGFHEKIIIIDNQVGFCGGFDLMGDKWDTPDHHYDNPLRERNAIPWHDVHTMIKGPILWDLILHFNQRWMYTITKDIDKASKTNVNSLYAKGSVYASTLDGEGDTEIVALRTWKGLKDKKENKEDDFSIYSWHVDIFNKAQDFIYIEDQFPFQDVTITRVLADQLYKNKNLQVLIVGPLQPSLPSSPLALFSKETLQNINNNLLSLQKSGKGRVKIYSLVSQHPSLVEKRKEIYVHSKLMIVDDYWIRIGSSNMDINGFKDSTEFDIGIRSPTLARQLRIKLWKEHLFNNEPTVFDFSINIDTDDFKKGFRLWEKIAEYNAKRVQNNESILGHVYFYNFKEMNFPSPLKS